MNSSFQLRQISVSYKASSTPPVGYIIILYQFTLFVKRLFIILSFTIFTIQKSPKELHRSLGDLLIFL